MKTHLWGAVSIYLFGLVITTSAQAISVFNDGDTIALGPGQEEQFIGNVVADGGAGSWSVDFESTVAGDANVNASVTDLVAGTFSGLTVEWVNTDTAAVLSSTPIVPVLTSLGTTFVDADSLNQTLRISWTESLDGAGFDIDTYFGVVVPLPAAVWLFGSGLLGLAGIARRKKA